MKKFTHQQFLNQMLADADFAQEYELLRPKYEAINLVIKNRLKKKMTQKDLAERIGTKQANISRFENGQINPSLEFLAKIAQGMGMKVDIRFKLG